MAEITVYDRRDQREIERFFAECVADLGWEYQPEGRHSDIVRIAEVYMRRGQFWLLRDEGMLAGIVAIHPIDGADDAAEMKRLYVGRRFQGRGYGGALFERAVEYARERGFARLYVDTRRDRAAALHLIVKHGFKPTEKYNDNAFSELYFELDLSSTPPDAGRRASAQ